MRNQDQDGIFEFLIDNATIASVGPLLIPDGPHILLFDHWPQIESSWWRASVPLSADGPNRDLQIRSLAYDVELEKTVFLEVLEELDRSMGGLTLVQSRKPLPANLHPRNFRREETYLRVLRDNGACLAYDLPHQNETAGLTVFGEKALRHLTENDLIDVDPDA